MLENIKSIYFTKIIFSLLDEKIKLNIIRYNKHLQNILEINLINYKLFSGRYIVYETKEKGKEYLGSNDQLIFEGEYLDGKRNGKGKEYNEDGSLKYEGEYLNGEKSGKGKEYYHGTLQFEGEYLKGKRNGKGKEFYHYLYNSIKFEGDFINGNKWNGKGYDKDKTLIYEIKNGNGMLKEKDMLGNSMCEGEITVY